VDNYGHVNNAVYLTYPGRRRGPVGFGKRSAPEVDFVIVRIAIDYRRELSQDDDEVTVSCRGVGYGTVSRSEPRKRSSRRRGGSRPASSR
jgi:acyl-CoA thioesterase FadM